MKKIALAGKYGKSKYIIVDNEDYPFLKRFKWHTDRHGNIQTVICLPNKKEAVNVLMHRLIVNASSFSQVNHINKNKLDNRKKNLRFANQSQIQASRGLLKNNTSGYKGVSLDRRTNRYRAVIGFKKRKIYLGTFNTAEEAAFAYDRAAEKYFDEFAKLNFSESETK